MRREKIFIVCDVAQSVHYVTNMQTKLPQWEAIKCAIYMES